MQTKTAKEVLLEQISNEYTTTEKQLMKKEMFDTNGNGLINGTISSYFTDYGLPKEIARLLYVVARTPAFKRWFGDWERTNDYKWLMHSEPVATLTGTEFQKGEISLVDMVNEYYHSIGQAVYRKGIGIISLTRKDIQTSIAHGIGKLKASAFKAVPTVIKQGRILGETTDYKQRGYESIVIDAPIIIGDEEYTCEVVVNKKEDTNDFYLHEVELKEKLRNGNQVRTYNGQVDQMRNTNSKASRLIVSKLYDSGKFDSSCIVSSAPMQRKPHEESLQTLLQQ